MPIYEYRCRACGAAFERFVQRGQEAACPACHSSEVTRLLSLFGFKSGAGFVASTGGGCGCGRGGCGCH
jgi:putative FmdB family regulatory protein